MEPPRQDLFTPIHKAIRSMIYETGSILQSADFRDYEEEQAALKILGEHLKMLKSHGQHEDNNIFNRLNEYDHETANIFFHEHNIIHKKYESLTLHIKEMLLSNTENKSELALKINRGFNDFAAFYFSHMNKEEEIAIPSTQKYFSDEELAEMRMKIQSSIPPDEYKVWMQYMLPSLNNLELTGLFKGLKLTAPAEVLERMTVIAEELIGSERFEKIKREAEL